MVYLRNVPDANHLLGYYPVSVDTIYDTILKAAFNRDVLNTFECFNISKSYVLYTDLMFRKYLKKKPLKRATRVMFSAGTRLSVSH